MKRIDKTKELNDFIFDVERCRFVPDSRAGTVAALRSEYASDDIGWLFRFFSLEEALCIGLTEKECLQHLDTLSKNRQLKVFGADIPRVVGKADDINFSCEIGVGLLGLCPPLTARVVVISSLYLNHKMSEENYAFGSVAIDKPSEKVQKLRDEMEAAKVRQWGIPPSLTLERSLHLADITDGVNFRRAVLAAAGNSKRK